MAVKPEVVKQLAELVDGDQWQMADLLAEEFPPEEWGEGTRGTRTGLHEALRQYEIALAKERGIDLTAQHLARMRATALAWPDGARTPSAPFTVHCRLRGENRYQQMEGYLRRTNGAALSVRQLIRFRSEEHPRPFVPANEQLRRRLTSVVKSHLLGGTLTKRKDWWNAANIADESRAEVVNVLRDLADAIAGGDS